MNTIEKEYDTDESVLQAALRRQRDRQPVEDFMLDIKISRALERTRALVQAAQKVRRK